jgi:hypothetical protein
MRGLQEELWRTHWKNRKKKGISLSKFELYRQAGVREYEEESTTNLTNKTEQDF